jgi:hypothetical protein
MNTAANAPVVINGFTEDKAGKLRMNGKMVANDIAEAARQGNIIVGFDMASLKVAKPKKPKEGGPTMAQQLDAIDKNIGLLKVGMTAKIAIPQKAENGKDPKRSFVMSVVTKLNSVTQKDHEWSGRVFDSAADDEGKFFYVTRMADTDTPHTRKSTRKDATASTGSASQSLQAALDASRKHLGEGEGNKSETDDKKAQADDHSADVILDGGKIESGKQDGGEIIEEAQVVKH